MGAPELSVRILRWDAELDAYPVEATLDTGAWFQDGKLQLDRVALRATAEIPAYGRKLFDALFRDSILRAYQQATGRSEQVANGRLRVRLQIDAAAAELHAIPWERIYHVYRGHSVPLATSENTPFSRFTPLENPERDPLAERPLRLLFVLANPTGLPPALQPVDVAAEVEALLDSLESEGVAGGVRASVMPGRTGLPEPLRARLAAAGHDVRDGCATFEHLLRALPVFHAVHFVGHGFFERARKHGEGSAALYLEDKDGGVRVVTDDEIVYGLATAEMLPWLVFLGACETARREEDAAHPFVGLAPKLVKAGIPAVVAMQDVIPMDGSRQLMADFYRRLVTDGEVDRAMNGARRLLFRPTDPTWAVPLLFSQLRHGQLLSTGETRERPATVFVAPVLPANFVERPAELDALKALLTAPGAAPVVGIHGMGGSGKTTLATALVRDSEMRNRFPGGVLWATLGQDPHPLTLINEWLVQLGASEASSLEMAATRLRDELRSRACLIVIDDVWNPEAAASLLPEGESSATVITTRDADVLPPLGVAPDAVQSLGMMTPEQGIALFERRLLRPIGADELGPARHFGETVDYLPLALTLAASQVAEGATWQQLADALGAMVAELEALDAPVPEPGDTRAVSLRASLSLSLRGLSRSLVERFTWLGLLFEDAPITPAAAATIWQVTLAEAREDLQRLQRTALLTVGPRLPDGSLTYAMHDLVRDVARRLVSEPSEPRPGHVAGLQRTWNEAHSELLRRYRTLAEEGRWSSLPPDGYIHGHLAWHLEQAEGLAGLEALLAEEQDGGNGWYRALDRAGDAARFLADTGRAWALVDEQPGLGRAFRYALLSSSAATIAQNVPGPLLKRLVSAGLWTPAQALAAARQNADPSSRCTALLAVVPELTEGERRGVVQEALDAAFDVNVYDQAKLIEDVLPALPDDQRAAVLEKVLADPEDTRWSDKVGVLGKHLEGPHLARTLAAAEVQILPRERVTALGGLLPALGPEGRQRALEIGLEAAETMDVSWISAPSMAALFSALPEPERVERGRRALDQTTQPREGRETGDTFSDVQRARVAVSRLLPEPERLAVLREALDALAGLSGYEFTSLVEVLAPVIPDAWVPELLEATRGRPYWGLVAAGYVAPRLAPDVREANAALAVEHARREGGIAEEAAVLLLMSEYVPALALPAALDATRVINDAPPRAELIAGVVAALPVSARRPGLDQARRTAAEDREPANRFQALVAIAAAGGSEEVVDEAFELALSQEPGQRGWLLAELAPHMPEAMVRSAAAALGNAGQEYPDATALAALAGRLASFGDVGEAMAWTARIERDDERAQALQLMAPHLNGRWAKRAMKLFGDPGFDTVPYAKLLAALMPHLGWRGRRALSKALEPTDLAFAPYRAATLVALAPHLTEERRVTAVAEVVEGLETADDDTRLRTRLNLAPLLPTADVEEMLKEAMTFKRAYDRQRALETLVPEAASRVAPQRLLPIWRDALRRAAVLTRRGFIAELEIMMPLFQALATPEDVEEALAAIEDAGRWWP